VPLSDPGSPTSPSASPAVRSKHTARRRQPTSLGKITTGLAHGLGPEVPLARSFLGRSEQPSPWGWAPSALLTSGSGHAPGSVIGGRVRNSCVPGGGLDPLAPNSIRRGVTSCGTILAGGGGRASSPTEGAGIGVRLPVRRLGPPRRPARQKQPKRENSSVCASGSLREVEPPTNAPRVQPAEGNLPVCFHQGPSVRIHFPPAQF
jgi:hypothetical protein